MKSMMKIMLAGLLLAGAWRCWGVDSPLLDLRFSDLGWGKLSEEVWNPPVDQTVVRIQYEHRIVLPPTKEHIVFTFSDYSTEEKYRGELLKIYQELLGLYPGAELYPKTMSLKPDRDSETGLVWTEVTVTLPMKMEGGNRLLDWWIKQSHNELEPFVNRFYTLDDTLELQTLMREKGFAQGKELLESLAKRLHGSLSEYPLLDRYTIHCGSEYQVAPFRMWKDMQPPLATPDREKITMNCFMDLAFAVKLPKDEVTGTSTRPERLIRKKFTCRFKPDTACLVLLLKAQGDSMAMEEESIAGRRDRLKQIILRHVPTAEFQEWTMQMDIVPRDRDTSLVCSSQILLVLLPADASLMAKIVEETKTVMGPKADKNTKVVYGVRNGELVWQRWIDTIWRELRYPPDKKAGQPSRRIRYFCSSDLDMPYRLSYKNGMIRLPLAFYGFSPDAFEVTGEFEAIVQE